MRSREIRNYPASGPEWDYENGKTSQITERLSAPAAINNSRAEPAMAPSAFGPK